MFRFGCSLSVLLALSACTPQAPQVALQLSPEAPTTTDDLTLTVTLGLDTAADELDIAWFRDGSEVVSLADRKSAPSSMTARDEVWTVQVSTIDGDFTFDSDELIVANTAPTVDVEVEQAGPEAGQEVVASATSFDEDGDAIELRWSWTVDDADAGIDGPTVPAGRTLRGERWQVTVTAADGDASSTPSTASFTIGNSAPSIDAVAISPANPTVEDIVSCAASGWSDEDGDEAAYTYQWQINEEVATGDATLQTVFVKGDAITCIVTPIDESAEGQPFSATVQAANTAPQVTTVGFNTDVIWVGDSLIASPTATDADSDAVSYTYAWMVDGVVQMETSGTLTGFTFPAEVAVSVTAADGEASSEPWVSQTFTVANTVPSFTTATATPAQPRIGETLECSIEGWEDADGHSQGFTAAWYTGETLIGSSATLVGGNFSAGDALYCVATPFDGFDYGAPIASASITVINTAPTIADVLLNGPSAVNGSDLMATVQGAEDADGDDLTYTYAWTVDDQPAGAGESFAVAGLSVGQEVQVSVIASDGPSQSTPVFSAVVVVVNSAPIVESVSLSTESFTVLDTVEVSWTAADADDHDLQPTISWWVNDAQVDASGTTFDVATYAVRGDTIRASVTVDDGTVASEALASGSVDVSNAPPTAPVVSMYPAAPTAEDSIACELVTPSTDPDGDALTYPRSWTVESADGSEIAWSPEALEDEYLGLTVVAGDTIYCVATADDGFGSTDSEPASALVEESAGCSDSDCTVVIGDDSAWTRQRLAMVDGALELMSDVVGYDESGTFTVPDGVTQLTVYALGAGGGGRGDYAYGGGGGGAAQHTFTVTPGQSIPFTVGMGGVGSTGWSSEQPMPGTDSFITLGDITLLGGGGGEGSSNNDEYSIGGWGGVASGGTTNVRGGHGGNSSLGGGDEGLRVDGVCSGGGGSGPRNGGNNWWTGGIACFPAGPGGYGPPQYPTNSPGGDGVYGGGGGSGGNYGGLGGTGGSGYVQFSWHTASPGYEMGIGAAITDAAQSDTSTWTGMTGVQVSEDIASGDIFYAVSFDDHSSYAVNIDGLWRSIVRSYATDTSGVQNIPNNDARAWQVNAGAGSGVDDWLDCDTNTPAACVQQAFQTSANQMSGARLEEISSEEWSGTGGFIAGTFDFAVGIQTSVGDSSPSMNGLQIIR
ncbi:MAG: hypothetical protein ACI855_001307 [Myxococcota bacterium]|jgi:hypothetical protein